MSVYKWMPAILIIILSFTACGDKNKDVDLPAKPDPPEPEAPTRQQLLADSLFLYAKQIYYWNTSLPDSATFKPRGYVTSDTLTGLGNELFSITQIPINSSTGKPYEFYQYISGNGSIQTTSKYSYINKTSDVYGGGVSSNIVTDQNEIKNLKMTLDGKENELGFTMGFMYASSLDGTSSALPSAPDDSIVGLIRIVTKNSPAWNAGIRRGDIIAKINGNAWTYNNNLVQIGDALNGTSIILTKYNPTSKTYTDASFNKLLYTFNPVYKDTLITIGSKKIAYIAYKSFTSPDNTNPALDAALSKFSSATDLVIDLRYNGGGYVSSAEYFANSILPQSKNGGVLFKEIYNQTMQNKQATLLKNQPVYDGNNVKQNFTYFDVDYSVGKNTTTISKQGSFNASGTITNIYFIVSSNTASASELLINSVKPYFNQVYLINAPFSAADNRNYTYGKPVGFFEIRIGKYSVFMSNFESKNKNDEGGYYQGILTNENHTDDIRYDLGDPHETCFLAAIRKITGNTDYQPISSSPQSLSKGISTNSLLNQSGMPVGVTTKVFDMISTPKNIR